MRKLAVLKLVNAKLTAEGCDEITWDDLKSDGVSYTIDGMPWEEWLEAQLMD